MPYVPVEKRRRQFVDAAVQIIADEGLVRLTTRRIAEVAEAPLGALHYSFRNKDEIIELVCERAGSALRATFDDVDSSQGLEATIHESIQAFWRWVRENIGLHLAMMEILVWTIRSASRDDDLDTLWEPYGGELLRTRLGEAADAEGVQPAVPIEDLARFVIHRFDGLVFEFAASKDEATCGRQVDLLTRAISSMAKGEPTPEATTHHKSGASPQPLG